MISAAKLAIGGTKLVVSAGVGAIVGNAVKFTTPGDVSVVKKATIVVGSFILGSMVSNQATKYTEEQIAEVVAFASEIKAQMAAKKAEQQD